MLFEWCKTGKFQFHKGTIRTTYLSSFLRMKSYFNSIKVRLEPFLRWHEERPLLRFQFHKGTIRTHPHKAPAFFSAISIP